MIASPSTGAAVITPGLRMDIGTVLAALHGERFSLMNEKTTQGEIADVLIAAGIPAVREVRLDDARIIDLMCGRIGIEVKLAGAKCTIYRQCVRYCDHPDVDALILVTAVPVTLPRIAKPTYVLSLGKAWL